MVLHSIIGFFWHFIAWPARVAWFVSKKFIFFGFLSALLSFFMSAGITILIILTAGFLWFFAKPYFAVRFYKEQGAQGYFKPFGGFFRDRMQEARQQGDFMTYFKKIIDSNPDTRMITSNTGSKSVLFLVDPDLVKEFVSQPQLYRKAKLISGIEGLFEGQGILFAEGEQWKKQRKLLTTSFHSEFLKETLPIMSRVAENVYSKIGKIEELSDLENVDIQKINQRVSGDIIGNFFFGPDYNDYTFEGQSMTMGLRKLVKDGFTEMYTIWNAAFGAWFIRSGFLPRHQRLMTRIETFRDQCKTIISKERGSDREETNILLQSLLKQQKLTVESSMTDDEIVDTFISLFIAGTDPTGNLVSMILYYLFQNPETYNKTMSEIDEVLKGDMEITFEQTQRMDYTMAVIKETLRKANPQGILVFREALEDHQLKDVNIKKNTLVTFLPILNGYNKKYFPNFNEFNPERWLSGDKGFELKESPFAFTPFSAGPRNCLGQHLAIFETKVMLGTLLRKFKLSPSSNYTLRMTNRGTYEPLQNLRMSLAAK